MSSFFSASSASPRDENPSPRPVVLLTPDFSSDAANPTEAEYIVRANYCSAIAEAGGVPLIVPYSSDDIAAVLGICDGVVVTGSRPGVTVAPERESYEIALIAAATRAKLPLLGICHGMQLIGRSLGGQVVLEVSGHDRSPPTHIPFEVPARSAHPISIIEGSLLASLATGADVEVNSLHRHGLEGQGRFRVAAVSKDGVIEAIEGDTPELSLGIQWHPEYRLTPLDHEILAMFVTRCAERARVTRAA